MESIEGIPSTERPQHEDTQAPAQAQAQARVLGSAPRLSSIVAIANHTTTPHRAPPTTTAATTTSETPTTTSNNANNKTNNNPQQRRCLQHSVRCIDGL
jgi:hypothetical protein